MTDNEIIKALECCKIGECGECAKCVPNNNGKSCRDNLIDLASDLINRQKAEIETLTMIQKTLQKHIVEKDEKVKRVQSLFDVVSKSRFAIAERKVKAEAIKEFVNQAIKGANLYVCGTGTEYVSVRYIKKLAKKKW